MRSIRSTTLTRRAALAGISVLVACGAACAPPTPLEGGANAYSTDLALGDQSRPPTTNTPLTPAASYDAGFPSFIIPSPPDELVVLAAPTSVSTTVPSRQVECPQADLHVVPPPASSQIDQPPLAGTYVFRQHGTVRSGAAPPMALPSQSSRVLQQVTTRPNGTFSFEVAITELGATTVTTYDMVRPSGRPEADGLYITRTVMTKAGAPTKEFSPAPPGLRIFPLPAGALTWRSVAADPVHGVTATLEGAMKERARVDVCGEIVEGWVSEVTVTTSRYGTPDNRSDAVIRAKYTIAPQLGGLIIGDTVRQESARPGAPGIGGGSPSTVVEAEALLNNRKPHPR